jgi:hypothetical protein
MAVAAVPSTVARESADAATGVASTTNATSASAAARARGGNRWGERRVTGASAAEATAEAA